MRFYIQKVFLAVFLPTTPIPLLMSSKSSSNVSRNLKMAKMMKESATPALTWLAPVLEEPEQQAPEGAGGSGDTSGQKREP